MKKALVLVPAIYLAGCGLSYASVKDFMPRVVRYGMRLTTEYNYKSDATTTKQQNKETQGNKEKSDAFRESVGFGAQGYVYHPYLVTFDAEIIANQAQGHAVENGQHFGDNSGFEEYTLSANILQKKPYHAEISTSSRKPSLFSDYGDMDQSETEETEVNVFYDNLPWKGSVKTLLSDRITNSNGHEYKRSNDSVRADLLYYNKRGFSFSTGGRYDSSYSQGSESTYNSEYYIRNLVSDLWSSLWNTELLIDIENAADRDKKRFRGKEVVKTELPWNFTLDTNLDYERSKVNIDTQVEEEGFEVLDTVQKTGSAGVELTQKLFESLVSSASAQYSRNSSERGSYTNNRYRLRSSYKKKLWTGYVSGGIDQHFYYIDRTGRINIDTEANETHAAQAGGSFFLDRADADTDTVLIAVQVEEPDTTGADICVNAPSKGLCRRRWVLLQPDEWSVTTSDQNVEITVDNPFVPTLIPGASLLNVGSDPTHPEYNFQATYLTREANYVLNINTTVFHLGFGIWKGLVSGRYARSMSNQKLAQGEYGIGDLSPSVTEDTVGVIYQKAPFLFSAGYKILDTDYREKKWNVAGTFRKNLKFFSFMGSKIRLHYDRAEAQTSQSGFEVDSQEYNMNASLDSFLSFPKMNTQLFHTIGYEKSQGNIPVIQQNPEDGIWSVRTATQSDVDNLFNTAKLIYRFRIPRTRISLTATAGLSYEESADGSSTTNTDYSLLGGYVWRFGQTVVSLNGKYKWKQEDSSTSEGIDNSYVEKETRIHAKISRHFF